MKALKIVLIALGSLVIILLCGIWLLSPFIVKHFANDWLSEQALTLSDDSFVRINPFNLSVTIEELAIESARGETLSLGFAKVVLQAEGLLDREVTIKQFDIAELSLDVMSADEQLVISGISLPSTDKSTEPKSEPSAQSKPFTLSLPEFNLTKVNLNLSLEGRAHLIEINSLKVSDLEVGENSQKLALHVDALVNKSALNAYLQLEREAGEVLIRNKLSLNNLDLRTYKNYLPNDDVKIEGQVSLALESTAQVKLGDPDNPNASINLASLRVDMNDMRVEYHNLTYQSKSEVFELNNSAVELNSNKVALNTQAKFMSQHVEVKNKSTQDLLVSWDELMFKQIQASFELEKEPKVSIQLANTMISGLRASSKYRDEIGLQKPLLSMQTLEVSAINLIENHLDVAAIDLHGLDAELNIAQDKSLDLLVSTDSLLPESASKASDSGTELQEASADGEILDNTLAPKDKTTLSYEVQSFTLHEGATVYFKDRSVTPNVQQKLRFDNISLGRLDSRSPSFKTPFNIKGMRDEFSKFNFEGYITPLDKPLNLSLKGSLSELSLPEISPYVKAFLGFEFESGQLDTSQTIEIINDKLEGKINFALRGIKMEKSDNIEKNNLVASTAIPLNVALGMITDKNGNLKLSIPLSGDINDPSFGWNDLLKIVVTKAAMSQAKSYLMNTFVPYAQVVTVAMAAGGELLKVRIEDLEFEPGIAEISESQQTYLDQFVRLMQDKPKMQVKICAISTMKDLPVSLPESTTLEEKKGYLVELGEIREKNFKLAVTESGKIETSRVLFCSVKIDNSKGAKPRIEFSL